LIRAAVGINVQIRKIDGELGRPESNSLGRDDVRVFVSTHELVRDRPELEHVLSDADRAHIARFHFDADREIARSSRTLQRLALSSCAPVAPESWLFTAEPRHKPRIAGPTPAPDLEFSVANTQGLVVCAVAVGRRVGVDVERVRTEVPASVVRRCWSPSERQRFEQLPEAEQCRRFADVWTAKEAYAKAVGLGLALDLQLVGVEVEPDDVRLDLDTTLHKNGRDWTLAVWHPRPSHTVALCIEGDGEACRVTSHWLGAAPADRL